jgi:hypothetical protein
MTIKTWLATHPIISKIISIISSFIENHEKTILAPLIVYFVYLYFKKPTLADDFFVVAGAIFWLFVIFFNQTTKAKVTKQAITPAVPAPIAAATPVTPPAA